MGILTSYSWRVKASVFALLCVGGAHAQINIGTTNASDGAIDLTSQSLTLNLGEAANAAWDAPAPVAGKGVYDASRWAVVYKLSSLNIDAGYALLFRRHPSGAPVVILVQGNATINGLISLNANQTEDAPGPGGFFGGLAGEGANIGSAGLGPGGGFMNPNVNDLGGHGSFGVAGAIESQRAAPGALYGMPNLLQLIGGSGGGAALGGSTHWRGGHGGGAMLLAVRGTLTLNGQIVANGSSFSFNAGSGSGGAIRVIANSINFGSNHTLSAQPGTLSSTTGLGRIRIEANTTINMPNAIPTASISLPGSNARLWPAASDPTVRINTINNTAVPAEPRGQLRNIDVAFETASSIPVDIATTNTPTDGSWRVELRGVTRFGQSVTYTATLVGGNQASAVWRVTLPAFSGLQSVQPRVVKI